MIKLGSRVMDVYTKFEGIAVARTEWLYGCARICIEPTDLDKDGKKRDMETFDEQRVEVVEEQEPKNVAPEVPRGGPQDDPQRPADPVR